MNLPCFFYSRALLSCALVAALGASDVGVKKPNIIVFLLDDQDWVLGGTVRSRTLFHGSEKN